MMRIADFEPCLPDGFLRPSAASAATPPLGWFDDAGAPPPSISANVAPGARGLSASLHAERVLALLCDGPTEGP